MATESIPAFTVFEGICIVKSIFVPLCLLLTVSLAQAESLQQPVSYFSPHCGYAPVNVQTVAGFSTDGNYVLVTAYGRTACGSSGRGGGSVSYTYWCDQLTYDLGGHLATVTVLEPPTNAGVNNCMSLFWSDPNLVFESNSYRAYTVELNMQKVTAPYLVYAP